MTLDRMKEEKQRKRARRKQAIADRKLAAEQEETARQAAQIEDAAREEKKAERRKKKQEELEASIKDHKAASPTAAAPAVGAPLASPPRLLPELGSTAGSGMLSGALSPVMTTMSGPFDMNASLRSDTSSMLDSSKDALVRPLPLVPLDLPPTGCQGDL